MYNYHQTHNLPISPCWHLGQYNYSDPLSMRFPRVSIPLDIAKYSQEKVRKVILDQNFYKFILHKNHQGLWLKCKICFMRSLGPMEWISNKLLVIETASLGLWVTVWVSRQQSYVRVKCIQFQSISQRLFYVCNFENIFSLILQVPVNYVADLLNIRALE